MQIPERFLARLAKIAPGPFTADVSANARWQFGLARYLLTRDLAAGKGAR